MNAQVAANPWVDGSEVLRRHGKSFHFAGRILSPKTLGDSARLYAFCRYVDDIADGFSSTSAARKTLSRVSEDLSTGQSENPGVVDVLRLADTHGINTSILLELISGLETDLGDVAFDHWDDLIRYSFRVAGTVGIMMADILSARGPEARFHAIDLGIAMQLTNIARDVREDALAGRRYIPGNLLPGLSCRQIANPDERAQSLLREAVRKVLDKAEAYYQSGEAGLRYLPPRARMAILVAARIYRQIGKEIEHHDYAVWEGRAVVPTWKKLLVTARCLPRLMTLGKPAAETTKHKMDLHRPLAGLPASRFGGSSS
jgi:phytoene synthase